MLLLIALIADDELQAADLILHVWYSAFIRQQDMEFLASRIRPLIEEVNIKIKDRAKDKPWYSLGHGIVLAYVAIGLLSSLLMRTVLKAENERRNRGERDELIAGSTVIKVEGDKNGKTYDSVEAARLDKGDMWSGFRYTL